MPAIKWFAGMARSYKFQLLSMDNPLRWIINNAMPGLQPE